MNMSRRIIRPSTEGAPQIEPFRFFSPARTDESVPEPATAPEAPAKPESMRRRSYDFTPSLDPANISQQCESMLEEARLKVSEIEKEAYEKGFAEGQKAGGEVGEKMAEALLNQYSASVEALNRLRGEIFATSEREVIRLALEIARKIIKREVAIDEELILALVKVALDRVADRALISVRVNPKDHAAMARHHAALSDADALSESVKLIEDPLIGRGGCVIETESGTIDARIEEQLREIERGFFE
jgi:flagellar assembly protein FliH